MKRMIFGHIYDTKSAELIADYVDSNNSLSEAIYCEPDGDCFFVGSGGPNSIYSKYREHVEVSGSVIVPIRPEHVEVLTKLVVGEYKSGNECYPWICDARFDWRSYCREVYCGMPYDRFIAVEDSIGDIEIERWTCQRSGNSYIYIFEEGGVWGICYSGSVCSDACRKCRNYDCEMEGIVSSIDDVDGWEKAIDLMDRWCFQPSI